MSGVLLKQRLVLDDMIIEQSCPVDSPRFRCASFGVVHVTDSDTGKHDGDVDVYPWHRVREFRSWRARAATAGSGE